MVATNLVAASAAAVLVPAFAGPILGKLPGGMITVIILGAAGVYFGSKMEGIGGSVVVGAAAGLLVGQVANLVLGNKVVAAA